MGCLGLAGQFSLGFLHVLQLDMGWGSCHLGLAGVDAQGVPLMAGSWHWLSAGSPAGAVD